MVDSNGERDSLEESSFFSSSGRAWAMERILEGNFLFTAMRKETL
jgi:hypothetical protein